MAGTTTFETVLASFGNQSQVKGKRFEEAIKWWLRNDTIWANEFVPESVLLWSESPHRNGPDIGIDLTAEDFLGNIWAIQVKNWRANGVLPKSEIDKFLSASNTKSFSHRLLISTTQAISPNALRAIEDQEKPCTVILRPQLDESTAWDRFFKRSKEAKSAKVLLPHQIAAVEAVVQDLHGGGKGQLIMACGSGKTLTAQRISEALDSYSTLVLLPSLLLVQQTLQSWRNEATVPFLSLSVCSDESVNGDEPVSKTSQLPFPVTTDPLKISEALQSPGRKVIFSTYQSSEKLAEAVQSAHFKFDLVVCDEAHRLAGKVDKAYGTVLKEGALPSSRYLFMTATPKVFSTRLKKIADDNDIAVNSMDDVEKFGKVIHTFSFADAIETGILTDYRVVLMGVDDSSVHDLLSNNTFLDVDGDAMDANLLASHYGVAKAMARYSIRRVISFHSRVRKAREFVSLQPLIHAELTDKQSVSMLSDVISGKDSAFRRTMLLDQMRDLKGKDFALIGNSRCLTEGVDVPSLDGIAFVDPRSSQVDIVQAVGRAIRRGGGDKTVGYIIIPIFFRGEELNEEVINEGQFRPVWEVLNALKSHDSSLKEEIDSIRGNQAPGARTQDFPSKVILDFPIAVPDSFSEKIKTFLVEKTSSIWEEWLGRLIRFQNENGHCRPKRDYTSSDEAALATWVNHQRQRFNKGTLSLERIEKLEAIPEWTWDPFEQQWLEAFERLREFVIENGTSQVPSTHRDKYGKPLGKWVAKLRSKREQLNENQVKLLESLPSWSWDPFEDQWESAFLELRDLANEQGQTAFSRRLTFSDGRSVGGWIIKQRQTRNQLSEEKKRRLESLPGWSWDPYGESKQSTVSHLKIFVEEFGHANVPQKYVSGHGFKLGYSVGKIRNDYLKGRLDTRLIEFFESLPGWSWNARVDLWHSRFQLLKDFIEEQNRLPKNHEIYRGEKLGWWTKVQRSYKKKGDLDKQKIELLESLDLWSWDVSSDRWENGYQQLLTFLESSQGRPPKNQEKTIDGFGVATWVQSQRRRFDRLTADQKRKLMAFDWFKPFDQ